MINEPLFQNNIINTIIRNFSYYLFDTLWVAYAAALMLILYGFYYILRKYGCSACPKLFPAEIHKFDKSSPLQWSALAFFTLIIIIYSAVIYSLDDTLFNNFDLMSLNTIMTFHRGLSSYYSATRLAPVSFFDLNYLYAITHNFNIINIYIILKQLFISLLLYRFLNFMPVAKRLFLIGMITAIPSVFWINNIIFPEQNMLICILLSLIFAKKFSESGKYINLWYFIIFTTLAVYTKETVIVFYTGLMTVGVLQNVFNEKINFSNLFKPLKLAKEFPIEFFIFLIGLSFAVFYFFVTDTSESNVYIRIRLADYSALLKLYKYEIALTVLAWLVAIKKLIRKETGNALFNEGLLMGGTFVLLFIIFHLKIITILSHVQYKSYYTMLTAIFSSMYIFQNLNNRKILTVVFASSLIFSAVLNYKIYKNEDGWYYRETAEFFGKRLDNEKKITIMFSPQSEKSAWVRENWSSAYAYYFPEKNITFKLSNLEKGSQNSELSLIIYHRLKGYLTTIEAGATPVSGEYYIIKKGEGDEDEQLLAKMPHDLVFENTRFKVYKIK